MNRSVLLILGLAVAQPGVASAQATEVAPQSLKIGQENPPTSSVDMTPAGAGVAAPVCKNTVCAVEPKKSTKVVYSSLRKEYCRCEPQYSLFGLFGGGCGGNRCEKHTRNVLVKKVVPDCDTTQCVLKEMPIVTAPPLPHSPAGR